MAQWIWLSLPSCCPGFESQASNQRFYPFIFELCQVEKTKINKNGPELAHFQTFVLIKPFRWIDKC